MKLKITRCTLSQEHWYCCTRKPTICPYCKQREVKPSVFGYPSPEEFWRKKYHLQGCIPDFPRPRDWGCINCDAAFFKEKEAVVDYMENVYTKNRWSKGEDVAEQEREEKEIEKIDAKEDDWFEQTSKELMKKLKTLEKPST